MRKMRSITICCLIFLMFALCCVSCAKSPADLWREQYDLGVHYLESGDYEQATLAFEAAIEIEPKHSQAYTALLVTQLVRGNEAEAQTAWLDMQAAGMGTDEVADGILGALDVLIKAGADSGALLDQLSSFLAAQPDGAELLGALLESVPAQLGDENLPAVIEEVQEEVYTGEISPGSEEYEQLESVLYRFRIVPGGTYDCRNIITERTERNMLLNLMLSPFGSYIDALYPGEKGIDLWNFEGDWLEVEWVPDPLGKLGKYGGYSYANREKTEWILKNIFNCPQSAIEAMEAPVLNGEDDERYLYEDRFYFEIGGIGDPQSYPDIVSIQQIDRYYLVRYTFHDNYDDAIRSYDTALLKLKKIDGSFYWSLYYCQSGFLLDETSWVYQELPQIAEAPMIPLLQVQPNTLLQQTQRQTYTVTAEPWLNLRAGPGTDYDVIGSAQYGLAVTEIGRSDSAPGWIAIECENEYEEGVGYINYGWISTDYIE